MMRKRILCMLSFFCLTLTAVMGQTKENANRFSQYLDLMRYGAKGQKLNTYKKDAAELGLNLLYHAEERSELYLVWGQDLQYERQGLTETYTPTGNQPRGISLDLTPNGKERFTPITITLVFPDQISQQAFWREGLSVGCVRNDKPEATDIDATWSNVRGLKYIANAKAQSSWRYIYFYEKGGLCFCTFLF